LAAGDVTGGINTLQAFGQRVENLLGVDLGEFSSDAQDVYRAKINAAIQANITALLNEGNRTISDADRDRADQIGGAIGSLMTAGVSFKNRDLLLQKLKLFSENIDRNTATNMSLMNGLEDTWRHARPGMDPRGETYADILRRRRGELSGRSQQIIGSAAPVIRWKDMLDDKGKYRPGWRQKRASS